MDLIRFNKVKVKPITYIVSSPLQWELGLSPHGPKSLIVGAPLNLIEVFHFWGFPDSLGSSLWNRQALLGSRYDWRYFIFRVLPQFVRPVLKMGRSVFDSVHLFLTSYTHGRKRQLFQRCFIFGNATVFVVPEPSK